MELKVYVYIKLNYWKYKINKEILIEIIERCDEEELAIIKDLIVATFPNLDKIKDKR